MTFGEYFKKLRCDKHVTQKQIAESLGKSAMLVSGVESNKNGPFSERDLDLIAEKLKLTEFEKIELFNEAAKARGKLPKHLSDYIFEHPKIYEMLDVIYKMNLDNDEITEITMHIERIRSDV